MVDFSISRIEELRLTIDMEKAIADLLASSFKADFGGRSFKQNRHHVRFVAMVGDSLVGHLALCFRAIQMGGRRVDLIGIGEVAVDGNHQKQGIGSSLVQAALDEGVAARADFAALFGEQSIYEQAGFVPASNLLTIFELEGAKTGWTVREQNPYFRIKPLGDLAWDFDSPVDLAGFAF